MRQHTEERAPTPVDRYVRCFPTIKVAAACAGVSTEMLRRFRKNGIVGSVSRAHTMARACGFTVDAIELLGLDGVRRSVRSRGRTSSLG